MEYDAMHRSIAFAIQHQPVRNPARAARGAGNSAPKREGPALMKPSEGGEKLASFEAAMLPHLDSAYNLARWITRNEADAQDVVQEAYMRALRFFDGFSGGNGRGWLLAIVRNTCYTWMQRNRPAEPPILFDENAHFTDSLRADPETELLLLARRESLELCIRELPVQFREVIVMRELEGMSYREVAEAAGVPVGTVMSRLARARKRLERCLVNRSMGKAG
jgi:RNA polymerase sigma-70 factor (ECF subfamily)